MSQINGVVTGLVTNVNDPLKEGRVKVAFRWLADNHESDWVRIATMMTGNKRGSYFMPEVNDEVLVAFEHGDARFPYVIGFLWNGQDHPPNDDGINTKVRRLKTVSGHVLEFVDNQGEERILLKTKGGHKLHLNDKPGEEKIELVDQQGNNTLTIDTVNNSIELTSKQGSITLKAPTGSIKLDARTLELTSSTNTTISAQAAMEVKATASLKLSGTASASVESGGPVTVTGLPIKLN
jgi:uncharacterized protein involved in type VI secretion and phage assembly